MSEFRRSREQSKRECQWSTYLEHFALGLAEGAEVDERDVLRQMHAAVGEEVRDAGREARRRRVRVRARRRGVRLRRAVARPPSARAASTSTSARLPFPLAFALCAPGGGPAPRQTRLARPLDACAGLAGRLRLVRARRRRRVRL